MVLAGLLGMANAQNTSNTEGHVQSATAISRVLGDGRKVETIVPPGLLHTVLKECKTGCLNSISRTVSVPVASNCLMCSGVGGYFLSTCSSRFIAVLCNEKSVCFVCPVVACIE